MKQKQGGKYLQKPIVRLEEHKSEKNTYLLCVLVVLLLYTVASCNVGTSKKGQSLNSILNKIFQLFVSVAGFT